MSNVKKREYLQKLNGIVDEINQKLDYHHKEEGLLEKLIKEHDENFIKIENGEKVDMGPFTVTEAVLHFLIDKIGYDKGFIIGYVAAMKMYGIDKRLKACMTNGNAVQRR